MADEVDVEATLVGIVTAALYPSGTSQPCAAGVNCKVFRGYPTTQNQEGAKSGGYVNVSVSARNGVERNVSRIPMSNQLTTVAPVHTLTATVGGTHQNQITIGGTVAIPQNVIVTIGGAGQQQAFVYAVQSTDNTTSIATGVAALISAAFPGSSSSGQTVTVNSTQPVTANIASSGTLVQIVRQQEKSFQVSIWAPPSPTGDADSYRTAVARIVDPALADLIRIVMPDLVYAHIHYERTITMDSAQAQGLYRRDLYYWVEYATTISSTGYEVGIAESQLQAANGLSLPLPNSVPITTQYTN